MEGEVSPFINCTGISCLNDTIDNMFIMNDSYGDYILVDMDISFWQVPQLIILVLLFVFIVFGNICVLVAIGLSQTGRKTRMNFFIVNLAISDLTVGIFHVTVDIAERCLVVWHGGSALCKIVRFLQVLVVYASTFMIVSLSIDRVDAIARPMNFSRKATTVRSLVNAAWIVSGILSIPSFLLFDTVELSGNQHCIMILQEQWHWQLYITLVALTAFIIPALIIIVCYGIIMFVIWDKGRGFNNTFQSSSCTNRSPAANGRNKGIIPQAKIKTLKMTLIIVCVFVLSWCPYFVFNLIDVYAESDAKSTTQYAVTSLVQSLAPLNSAANPFIYGIFGTRICQNLRRIPCIGYIYNWICQYRRKQRNSQFRTSQSRPTEQTNLDVTSGKYVSMPRRGLYCGYRHIVKCDTATGGGQGSSVLHATTSALPNGLNNRTNHQVIQHDVASNDSSNEFKCFYRRRPSGLPLANRKMTQQETILLETFRSKGDNTAIVEGRCKDEKLNNGHLIGDYERQFEKIDERLYSGETADV